MAHAIEFTGVDAHPDFPADAGYSRPLPIIEFERSSVSCWRLSPEELAEIARTGVIWVQTSLVSKAPPEGEKIQPAMKVNAFKHQLMQDFDR